MPRRVVQLFDDAALVDKIKRRLPHLFHYAERDSSRAGKVGMEVGSLRERILVSLLILKFGRENVETDLPITEHEVDVRLHGEALSIKTVTTTTPRIGAVKAIWTVDADQAGRFVREFTPRCDYLLAHIVWDDKGGLYYVPFEAQAEVFSRLGRSAYLKLPKAGTNPRGVEITADAMAQIANHGSTREIVVDWKRPVGEYDQYERWIEYWRLD
jgi:hypothetical protein